MNIADMRTTHSRDAYTQLSEAFGEKVFATRDPRLDRLRGVRREGAVILEYRPDLGADYLHWPTRCLSRIGREDARGALAPMLLH